MKIEDFLKRENNNLDLIRIILACMVIVGHSPALNGPSDYWVDPITYFFKFTYSGALAVKIFFFISGLVVTNSLLHNRSATHFIISRFFRLFPALLFVLIITVFVFGPILTSLQLPDYFSNLDKFRYIRENIVFNTYYSLPGLFNNNIYGDAVNGSLWSLRYEMGCYIALLGSFLVLANEKKHYLNIPIALIFIDALLPTKVFFYWLGENPEINILLASFALGVFFAINADKIKIDLGTVFGSFLIYYLFSNSVHAQLILVYAFCTMTVYLASKKAMLRWRPKMDISYGIYLWGFLIQQSVFLLLGHTYVGLHCLISIVISILLAFITYIAIEKPFMNLGKISIKMYKERFLSS